MMDEASFKLLLDQIAAFQKEVSETSLSPAQRRRVQAMSERAISDLCKIIKRVDPIKLPELVFNPTDPDTFAEAIGNKLMVQDERPLESLQSLRFYGSGLYAIYYKGDFKAYRPIKGTVTPIYVGKADPPKGAKSPREQEDRLWKRLREHAGSIEEVEAHCAKSGISGNLRSRDFTYRSLVTATGWQVAAEGHLISLFRPIWNKESGVVRGIGKHGDDSGTRANERSRWDTLHPGREWATHSGNKPNRLSGTAIEEFVAKHFRSFPPKIL